MPKLLCAGLILVVGLPACSSDSFDNATPDASAPTGDTTAASLTGLAVTSPLCGTDSQGQVAECRSCVEAQCAPNLAECFGDAYLSTLDGGVCRGFGQCVMACPCGDQVCYQACIESISSAGASQCTDCLGRLLSCESGSCGDVCAGGAADAGADSGRRGQ
jgi:hypothetical protein